MCSACPRFGVISTSAAPGDEAHTAQRADLRRAKHPHSPNFAQSVNFSEYKSAPERGDIVGHIPSLLQLARHGDTLSI
jgi:hypothetical protein